MPPPLPQSDRRKLLWPLLLAVMVTWCSAGSVPDVGGGIPYFDKIVHFFVYGLMATLVARLGWVQQTRPLGIYAAVLLVSVFGITDELHQYFTPERSMDVYDWIADTLGASLATLLYAEWRTYRNFLETPFAAWFGKRRVEIAGAPCVIAADGLSRSS
ncbi:MAG TPA: VanZ family protein [Opitutus sp.]|nr:VanZ family protein [Opitutus sp.]